MIISEVFISEPYKYVFVFALFYMIFFFVFTVLNHVFKVQREKILTPIAIIFCFATIVNSSLFSRYYSNYVDLKNENYEVFCGKLNKIGVRKGRSQLFYIDNRPFILQIGAGGHTVDRRTTKIRGFIQGNYVIVYRSSRSMDIIGIATSANSNFCGKQANKRGRPLAPSGQRD